MIKFSKVSYKEFLKAMKNMTHFQEPEIKKFYDEIELPKRSTKTSAGYDFRMPFGLVTTQGFEGQVPTGIKAYMDKDAVLMLYPRSSLGMRYGFRLLNTTGIIDSDYADNKDNEGHIMVKFSVESRLELSKGDKLCQGIFVKYLTTDDDSATGDREGGMGSTGK